MISEIIEISKNCNNQRIFLIILKIDIKMGQFVLYLEKILCILINKLVNNGKKLWEEIGDVTWGNLRS